MAVSALLAIAAVNCEPDPLTAFRPIDFFQGWQTWLEKRPLPTCPAGVGEKRERIALPF